MINIQDELYLNYIKDILDHGQMIPDRTGVGTISVIDRTIRFKMSDGFPLITTKKVNWRAIVSEFIWMVCLGRTDLKWLQDLGHTFWDEWGLSDGTIGDGYGKQFRDCDGVDQVANLIDGLRNNPYSRRHIINLWNVKAINEKKMALEPCHMMTQWFVRDNQLSCKLYQRSVDSMVGLPFNIAFYALFLHVVAKITNLEPYELIWNGGDCHIYLNHIQAAKTQLLEQRYAPPKLTIEYNGEVIDNFTHDMIKINNYKSGPPIKLSVAV